VDARGTRQEPTTHLPHANIELAGIKAKKVWPQVLVEDLDENAFKHCRKR
jgi:hypothetical protein